LGPHTIIGVLPTVLVVVAHPDDETFGTGSLLASAAARGARVVVCCATRGEAGEDMSGTTSSPAELAAVREGELRRAAKVLGVTDVVLLDFADSDMQGDMPPNALAAVDIEVVVAPLVALIAELQPDIVVSLDPVSIEDHRDHTRIGEATGIAFARAATPDARLYYWTIPCSIMVPWLKAIRGIGELGVYADLDIGRPDADITTVLDVADVIDTRRAAIAEHRTQHGPFAGLAPDLELRILNEVHLVRAHPPWDGGPVETSLW
jgi:LmbE family N-acetylglucosaminyl deacetylase